VVIGGDEMRERAMAHLVTDHPIGLRDAGIAVAQCVELLAPSGRDARPDTKKQEREEHAQPHQGKRGLTGG
jgi:hypothetical protein